MRAPAERPHPGHPTLRSLALPVYLPTILFTAGEGAVIPFIVLGAQDLGASAAAAGGVFALRGIATLLSSLPAGRVVSLIGERRAMVVATGVMVAALTGGAWTSSVWVFAACVFAFGCGWALWMLARFTYVTGTIPGHLRGRALSTLGGAERAGHFVGPLLAAAVVGRAGVDGVFYFGVAACLLGVIALSTIPNRQVAVDHNRLRVRFTGLAREHAHAFRTVGVAVMIIGALRAARPVAVPLWATHIGLDPAAVGLIFGLSSAVDMVLFYPVGALMDRSGRKYAAVPCAALLSAAFLFMPLAYDFPALLLVGLLMGLANGLGSGIVMTLGSDSSPTIGRAEFLGLWHLISNTGQTAGPLLVASAAGAASIGVASVVVGVLGLGGALFIGMRVPETLQRTRRPAPPGVPS